MVDLKVGLAQVSPLLGNVQGNLRLHLDLSLIHISEPTRPY